MTANVTNLTIGCGAEYTFDFGGPHIINVLNQSVLIKIWTTIEPGDVHIYWDAECCPSALYLGTSVGVETESWGTIKQLYEE